MSEYARLVVAVDSTQVGRADADLQKFGQTAVGVERQSAALTSSVAKLGPALATVSAALSARQFASYADTWSDLTSRVRLSIGAHESAAVVMSRLSDIARGTYSNLEDTAESFAQNAVTLRALGKSTLDQLTYTEALNNALVVSGAKADRAQMVQNSLSKAMAEGSLRGLELNNVLNSGSRVAELLADELGVNITQLRGVASEGKITGDVIFTALTKNIQSLKEEAESMPATIGDGFLLIRNAALESVGVFDQQAKISEELAEKLVDIADAIRDTNWTPYISAAITAAKVITAYKVATISATVATAAWEFRLVALGTQSAMTAKQVLSLRTAAHLAAAAFAGWEIGTYLRSEFEVVEKAGIALMSGLHQAAIRIEGEFTALGESMKFALSNPLDFARGAIADFLEWMTGLGANALSFLGLDGLAAGIKTEFDGVRGHTAAEHKAAMAGIRAETQAAMAGVSDIYFEMFNSVGAESEKAAGAVSDLSGKVGGLGSSQNVGGIKKIDTAFQSLMDSLFPAEAAQRKYNEQLDLLKKHLSGDRLSKAIDRLNDSMGDGDHTGPADAIKAYIKELERLEDQINPAGRAAREFREQQALLRKEIERSGDPTGKYTRLLGDLERQYEENTRVTTEWAKWTESSLERVDSAFADAWRNIGDGFSSFRDSLTNAFKQMLAELAHMAITKPIIMQIGAAMGIGGGAGALASMGGGGIGGIGGIAKMASSAYSAVTGWGKAAYTGYQAGGLSGALSGVGGHFGGMLSGGMGGFGAGVQGAYLAPGLAGPTTAGAGGMMGLGSTVGTIGAYAPWLGGAAGALMGYQQSGLKGAAAGGLGGFGGAKLGASLGSFAGPIGTAVGAIAGGILGAVGGSKLFGGKWQTKDVGLSLGVGDGDFLGHEFEYQKKKGGLFSSNKKRTRFSDLDPETAAAMQGAFDATEMGVTALFAELSYSIEEGALDGLQMAKTQISTKGKSEQEIQEAIGAWFGSVSDAMTAELNSAFGTGLDLDFEGLQLFVGNLMGVNEVLRYLNVEMYESSVAGGKLAESLSAVSGGLDVLTVSAATYYDQFFTAEEKAADTIDAVTRAFEAADVQLADSREAYRAMVEDIDVTTEAGQQMFATMMALSGQAAQYFSIVEQQAAQVVQQAGKQFDVAMSLVQTSFSRLQQSIGREVDALRSRAGELQAGMSALTSLSNTLRQSLRSMRLESDQFDRAQRARAQGELQGLIALARGGGSLSDADVSGVLSELGRDSTQLFGSFEDYARDYWKTAHDINDLARITDDQLTADEQILQGINLQIDYYDQMLIDAQRQIDALLGIDNSVMSVAAAMAGFRSSVSAAQVTPQGAVQTAYQQVLGRTGDADGVAYWTQQLASGAISQSDLKRRMAEDALRFDIGSYAGPVSQAELLASQRNAEKYLRVPGFASGGVFGGGMRIVGEQGPELEVTGPSRIYSAGQTASMLNGGGNAETVAELRQLRTEIHSDLRAIAKHTQQTAKRVEYLERWDFDGLPEERAAV